MARRFFVRPLPAAGRVTLSPKLGHHLGRLIRKKPGDAVSLFDGAGGQVSATVIEVRGRDVQVEVGQANVARVARSSRLELTIACALPRASRTDWLLEHGTELGVHRFLPLLTERAKRHGDRRGHWERVLVKACAQCDRAWLPEIEDALTLAEFCERARPAESFVAAFGAPELGPVATPQALLVIGPEGGLTDRELGLLEEAGLRARSLGPLTLRTETAVLAGATRILQQPPTPSSEEGSQT